MQTHSKSSKASVRPSQFFQFSRPLAQRRYYPIQQLLESPTPPIKTQRLRCSQGQPLALREVEGGRINKVTSQVSLKMLAEQESGRGTAAVHRIYLFYPMQNQDKIFPQQNKSAVDFRKSGSLLAYM